MSIGTDNFGSTGHFPTYDPFAIGCDTQQPHLSPPTIFQLQCRSCGFEPEDVVTPPRYCPKCHGESWERFAKPRSILNNAERS